MCDVHTTCDIYEVTCEFYDVGNVVHLICDIYEDSCDICKAVSKVIKSN